MFLRIAFKATIILILAVCGMSYIAYLNTGRFWLPKIPSWPDLPSISAPDITGQGKLKPLQPITQPAYKWRENGRWVYGDQPPFGVKATQINKE